MNCKKCKKEIPDGAFYCPWCGAPQKRNPKKKMYQRPDGLYEQIKTINGKRIAFRGKTEKEVTDKMLEYQKKEESGPRFKEVAENWKEAAYADIEYNTAKGYNAKWKHAVEYFGDCFTKEIKSNDVRAYVGYLAGKGFAYKTVAHHLSVLRLILDYAVLQNIIPVNPAVGVTVPKRLPRSHREMPSQADLDLIQKNASNGFWGLIAAFMLYTGCRSGEVFAIRQKDIDRESQNLSIRSSVYYENNKPKLKEPKTISGVRVVPIPNFILSLIPEGAPGDFVFSPDPKHPISDSQRRKGWVKFQKEIGISCTPHQLRHAYATLLYESGVDEKTAQKLLGHSDIATTLNIYTHIREQKLQLSREVFSNFLNARNSPNACDSLCISCVSNHT